MRHPALLSIAALAAAVAHAPIAYAQTGASAATGAAAQQHPAPIVRLAPKAATSSTGSTGPKSATGPVPTPQAGKPSTILTQSFAVPAKKATPAVAPTIATPKPTPVTTAPRSVTPPPAPKPQPQPAVAQAPSTPVPAQPTYGVLNKSVIVLDASHGGVDGGSHIADSVQEKDVTLAFAFKLRSMLTARGLTVVMTRDTDAATPANNPGNPLTLDDRAGIANHARPAACLLIHATGSGTGVHLYTSELDPAPGEAATLPWLTAQSAWVTQSKKLADAISTALKRSRIPLVSSSASVRPVDSLTCPALIVELAPQNGDDETTIKDGVYQQQIAEVIATTLAIWKNQVQAPEKLAPPEKTDTSISAAGATP